MRQTSLPIVVACVLWLFPLPSAAEPYAALVAGAAFSERNDLDVGIFFDGTLQDVHFDTSAVFGGKAGYFFERTVLGGNLGVEFEVAHFRPNIDDQDVNVSDSGVSGRGRAPKNDLHVTPVTLNGLYRLPIARSDEMPSGRLQPYVGAGVGAFIANLKGRISQLDAPRTFEDTDVALGFQGLAGLSSPVTWPSSESTSTSGPWTSRLLESPSLAHSPGCRLS